MKKGYKVIIAFAIALAGVQGRTHASPNQTYQSGSSVLYKGSSYIDIDLKVINNGSSYAGSNYVGFYLSLNTTISTGDYKIGDSYVSGLYSGDYSYESGYILKSTNTSINTNDYKIGDDFVSALSAGASSTEDFLIYLSQVTGVPAGSYYVGYIIDYQNSVTESSEIDNTYCFTNKTVTIGGVQGCNTVIKVFPHADGFESSIRSWKDITGDDMDWTQHSGSTSSSYTGPFYAYQGSYYIYTEASGYYNKEAIVESPCFDFSVSQSPQIEFMYHMYGSSMGTLYLPGGSHSRFGPVVHGVEQVGQSGRLLASWQCVSRSVFRKNG